MFLQTKKQLALYTVIIVICSVLLSVGASAVFLQNTETKVTDVASALQNNKTASSTSAPGLNENTISDMVKLAGVAVVKIETTSIQRSSNIDPFMNDPFFNQFFGNDFNFKSEPQETKGLGSGFLITTDGYILTNNHVIAGASDIKVQVTGYKNSFPAKVIGKDSDLDLAVFKISGNNFPVLKLGNSDNIQVGNWVVAIGNPLGLDHTVTVGVVSAKGRPITIENTQYKNLLQTDASINPGNSGGPLLNLNGEVIGINTAVNASAQGIGFAIPSSTVQEVLNDLLTKGKVAHPWLGVYMQAVTSDLKTYFNLPSQNGAIITNIVSGSPADKAGLQRGDVVMQFNKIKITTPEDLQNAVKKLKTGQKAVALVWRNGRSVYITINITEKPDN